jgi:hypothetical protein
MKKILIIFLFLVNNLAFSQGTKTVNPNPPYVPKAFKYNKVIAYKLKPGTFSIVMHKVGLVKNSITGQKVLTGSEIDTLHKVMRNLTKTENPYTKEDQEGYAGVVYYLNDSIVGHFNIAIGDKITLYYRLMSEPRHVPNNKLLMNKRSHAQVDLWITSLAIKED